jgi:short-subunit dehydrogenase
MKLTAKVAVVTGASMGIGEAIARLFVEQGAFVVLSSRDQHRAEAARQRICTAASAKPALAGGPAIGALDRTITVACDVRCRAEIERLAAEAMARFGCLDIWVNNAGLGLADTVADMDMTRCRDMFDTNLFGAIHGMQVAAAIMVRQGSGTIVNISSAAGEVTMPYGGAYSASKAALSAVSRAANFELYGTGVNVVTVCPGYIPQTNFSANVVLGQNAKRIRTQRGGTPRQVAEAVLSAYQHRRRNVVVPAFYGAIIALSRFAPGLTEYLTRRAVKPL